MPEQPRPGTVAARLAATTTIVVVEDEHDIAEFVTAYLRAVGFAVAHVDATSPDAAMDEIAAHQPALILLDMHLRGFTGFDVYRRVRSRAEFARVPVIVVSADNREVTRTTARRLGIDTYVAKPFDPRMLHDAIREGLDRAAVMHDISVIDELTGCFTHSYAQERLADEVAMARRQRTSVGFALARILGLREINTRHGHSVGDFVIREVAQRMRVALPDDAVLARNAGPELAVIVPDTTTDDLTDECLKMHGELTAPITLPGGAVVHVGLAMGCASYPSDAADRDALFMAADAALADARDAGQGVRAAMPELG